MLFVAAGRMVDSPDPEAESSFPERHLEDDETLFSGIRPDGFQSVGPKRQMLEPGLTMLSPQQRWPLDHALVGGILKLSPSVVS